jgi:hypothetical protein
MLYKTVHTVFPIFSACMRVKLGANMWRNFTLSTPFRYSSREGTEGIMRIGILKGVVPDSGIAGGFGAMNYNVQALSKACKDHCAHTILARTAETTYRNCIIYTQ